MRHQDDPLLPAYLKEIGSVPLLSECEEQALFIGLEKANDALFSRLCLLSFVREDYLSTLVSTRPDNGSTDGDMARKLHEELLALESLLTSGHEVGGEEAALEKCAVTFAASLKAFQRNLFVPGEELVELCKKAKKTALPDWYQKKIAEKISTAKGDRDLVKKEIADANLRLVVNVAKRFLPAKHLKFLDFIQEGNLGLLKAIDRFEHWRGNKFSSYAFIAVIQSIARAVDTNDTTIHVPANQAFRLRKIRKVFSKLVQELKRDPTQEELEEETEEKAGHFFDLLLLCHTVSLSTPVGDGDTFLEDFRQNSDPDAFAWAEKVARADAIREELARLKPIERRTLELHFCEGLSFPAIARELAKETEAGLIPKLRDSRRSSYTDERVRQFKEEATRKLRGSSRSKRLKSFWE